MAPEMAASWHASFSYIKHFILLYIFKWIYRKFLRWYVLYLSAGNRWNIIAYVHSILIYTNVKYSTTHDYYMSYITNLYTEITQ